MEFHRHSFNEYIFNLCSSKQGVIYKVKIKMCLIVSTADCPV